MEDNKKQLPHTYINTPFAYTKLSKNLSLLQQTMLNKVSEHLQSYIQYYYGSDLKNSPEKPRPLFSKAEKNSGLPSFMVSYAELGVSIAHYDVARKAIKEVLALTIEAPSMDDNGNAIMKYQLVFSSASASSIESNGVIFTLNPAVVDWVFDMSQGYVRHPADIARIGQVERMPMMYYLLFKKSERWKFREVHLTVWEIKDYLGLLKNVKEGSAERAGRKLKDDGSGKARVAYPKFSQFKKNVLDTSIADINRLRKDGLLDVCVSFEPVYNGARKVGDPAFIKFSIYETIEEMQKATARPAQADLFATDTPGMAEWQKVLQLCPEKIADGLKAFAFQSYDEKAGAIVLGASSRAQVMDFEKSLSAEDMETLKRCLVQGFGKTAIQMGYRIRKD